MADRSALEAAAAAGVINAEQVGPLYNFLSSQQAGVKPALAGEEDLRFIRNFHDVFLAIGIVLFAVGLAIAIGTWVAGSAHEPRQAALLAGGLSATAAVVMWLLGEVFARRRRLFLPAIALGFISLLINRRVLIVSALLTTGVAIGVIMNEFGLGAGALAASTLIVLGGFVLILGAGWHAVRRTLLGWVKPDGAWARIFPPEAPAAA